MNVKLIINISGTERGINLETEVLSENKNSIIDIEDCFGKTDNIANLPKRIIRFKINNKNYYTDSNDLEILSYLHRITQSSNLKINQDITLNRSIAIVPSKQKTKQRHKQENHQKSQNYSQEATKGKSEQEQEENNKKLAKIQQEQEENNKKLAKIQQEKKVTDKEIKLLQEEIKELENQQTLEKNEYLKELKIAIYNWNNETKKFVEYFNKPWNRDSWKECIDYLKKLVPLAIPIKKAYIKIQLTHDPKEIKEIRDNYIRDMIDNDLFDKNRLNSFLELLDKKQTTEWSWVVLGLGAVVVDATYANKNKEEIKSTGIYRIIEELIKIENTEKLIELSIKQISNITKRKIHYSDKDFEDEIKTIKNISAKKKQIKKKKEEKLHGVNKKKEHLEKETDRVNKKNIRLIKKRYILNENIEFKKKYKESCNNKDNLQKYLASIKLVRKNRKFNNLFSKFKDYNKEAISNAIEEIDQLFSEHENILINRIFDIKIKDHQSKPRLKDINDTKDHIVEQKNHTLEQVTQDKDSIKNIKDSIENGEDNKELKIFSFLLSDFSKIEEIDQDIDGFYQYLDSYLLSERFYSKHKEDLKNRIDDFLLWFKKGRNSEYFTKIPIDDNYLTEFIDRLSGTINFIKNSSDSFIKKKIQRTCLILIRNLFLIDNLDKSRAEENKNYIEALEKRISELEELKIEEIEKLMSSKIIAKKLEELKIEEIEKLMSSTTIAKDIAKEIEKLKTKEIDELMFRTTIAKEIEKLKIEEIDELMFRTTIAKKLEELKIEEIEKLMSSTTIAKDIAKEIKKLKTKEIDELMFRTTIAKEIEKLKTEEIKKLMSLTKGTIPSIAKNTDLQNWNENFQGKKFKGRISQLIIKSLNLKSVNCLFSLKKEEISLIESIIKDEIIKYKELDIKDDKTLLELLSWATYITTDKEYSLKPRCYFPRATQMAALLSFLQEDSSVSRGKIGEVYTGEGKTLITAMFAISKILKGNKDTRIDIATSNKVLADEAVQNNKALFNIFGINAINISSDKNRNSNNYEDINKIKRNYTENQIIYGDFSQFVFDNAYTKFGGLTYRQENLENIHLFVDEADNQLVDNITTPCIISENYIFLEKINSLYEKIYHYSKSFDAINNSEEILIKKYIIDIIHKDNYSHFIADFMAVNTDDIISSIKTAREYESENQYKHTNNKIQIYDINTGILQNDVTWSNGLHQFLELSNGLKSTIPTASAIFGSYRNSMDKYRSINGTTGTIGGKKIRDMLQREYQKKDQKDKKAFNFFKIPRFKLSKTYEKKEELISLAKNKSKIKEETLLSLKQSDHIKYAKILKEELLEKKLNNNKILPTLIICQNSTEVDLMVEYICSEELKIKVGEDEKTILLDDKENKKCFKIYKIRDQGELKKVLAEKEKMKSSFSFNDIIVATNISGRGTDLPISGIANQYGGLKVIFSYVPKNDRILWQGYGRTGRSGAPGSYKIISYANSGNIKDINKKNQHEMKMTLENVSKNLKSIVDKDEFLKDYYEIKQKLLSNIPDSYSDIVTKNMIERVLDSQWVVALNKIDQLKEGKKSETEIIDQKKEIFDELKYIIESFSESLGTKLEFDNIQLFLEDIGIHAVKLEFLTEIYHNCQLITEDTEQNIDDLQQDIQKNSDDLKNNKDRLISLKKFKEKLIISLLDTLHQEPGNIGYINLDIAKILVTELRYKEAKKQFKLFRLFLEKEKNEHISSLYGLIKEVKKDENGKDIIDYHYKDNEETEFIKDKKFKLNKIANYIDFVDRIIGKSINSEDLKLCDKDQNSSHIFSYLVNQKIIKPERISSKISFKYKLKENSLEDIEKVTDLDLKRKLMEAAKGPQYLRSKSLEKIIYQEYEKEYNSINKSPDESTKDSKNTQSLLYLDEDKIKSILDEIKFILRSHSSVDKNLTKELSNIYREYLAHNNKINNSNDLKLKNQLEKRNKIAKEMLKKIDDKFPFIERELFINNGKKGLDSQKVDTSESVNLCLGLENMLFYNKIIQNNSSSNRAIDSDPIFKDISSYTKKELFDKGVIKKSNPNKNILSYRKSKENLESILSKILDHITTYRSDELQKLLKHSLGRVKGVKTRNDYLFLKLVEILILNKSKKEYSYSDIMLILKKIIDHTGISDKDYYNDVFNNHLERDFYNQNLKDLFEDADIQKNASELKKYLNDKVQRSGNIVENKALLKKSIINQICKLGLEPQDLGKYETIIDNAVNILDIDSSNMTNKKYTFLKQKDFLVEEKEKIESEINDLYIKLYYTANKEEGFLLEDVKLLKQKDFLVEEKEKIASKINDLYIKLYYTANKKEGFLLEDVKLLKQKDFLTEGKKKIASKINDLCIKLYYTANKKEGFLLENIKQSFKNLIHIDNASRVKLTSEIIDLYNRLPRKKFTSILKIYHNTKDSRDWNIKIEDLTGCSSEILEILSSNKVPDIISAYNVSFNSIFKLSHSKNFEIIIDLFDQFKTTPEVLQTVRYGNQKKISNTIDPNEIAYLFDKKITNLEYIRSIILSISKISQENKAFSEKNKWNTRLIDYLNYSQEDLLILRNFLNSENIANKLTKERQEPQDVIDLFKKNKIKLSLITNLYQNINKIDLSKDIGFKISKNLSIGDFTLYKSNLSKNISNIKKLIRNKITSKDQKKIIVQIFRNIRSADITKEKIIASIKKKILKLSGKKSMSDDEIAEYFLKQLDPKILSKYQKYNNNDVVFDEKNNHIICYNSKNKNSIKLNLGSKLKYSDLLSRRNKNKISLKAGYERKLQQIIKITNTINGLKKFPIDKLQDLSEEELDLLSSDGVKILVDDYHIDFNEVFKILNDFSIKKFKFILSIFVICQPDKGIDLRYFLNEYNSSEQSTLLQKVINIINNKSNFKPNSQINANLLEIEELVNKSGHQEIIRRHLIPELIKNEIGESLQMIAEDKRPLIQGQLRDIFTPYIRHKYNYNLYFTSNLNDIDRILSDKPDTLIIVNAKETKEDNRIFYFDPTIDKATEIKIDCQKNTALNNLRIISKHNKFLKRNNNIISKLKKLKKPKGNYKIQELPTEDQLEIEEYENFILGLIPLKEDDVFIPVNHLIGIEDEINIDINEINSKLINSHNIIRKFNIDHSDNVKELYSKLNKLSVNSFPMIGTNYMLYDDNDLDILGMRSLLDSSLNSSYDKSGMRSLLDSSLNSSYDKSGMRSLLDSSSNSSYDILGMISLDSSNLSSKPTSNLNKVNSVLSLNNQHNQQINN